MPGTKEITADVTLSHPQYYFDRELSWLEFNRRVLHEALDPRTPLLERVKFAAIFSSNLDEFFMVRVAVLKQQLTTNGDSTADHDSIQQRLLEIQKQVAPVVHQVGQLVQQELIPQLAAEGVYLYNYMDLNQAQRLYLKKYFEEQVFPILTPLAVDPAHPFPVMSNLSLNLAVLVQDPDTGEENFARVKVPNSLPRFVQLPEELCSSNEESSLWTGVALEQVIANNLANLFPGMTIREQHLFRITRDADLGLREEEADDLLEAIEQELRRRHFGGSVVRLQVPPSIPESVLKLLIRGMELSENEIYHQEGWLGLRDFMSFMALPLPHLKDVPFTSVTPPRLRKLEEQDEAGEVQGGEKETIFSVIRQGDLLVHHPYESFTASVERFITEAAHDPHVQALKMTLYRTSGDSPIVKALIAAAENGKQVAALVELKARFDEESNINWARELEDAGVHVVYGLVGLKTHTKVVLVVRQEEGSLQRYVHVGTGNYNPKTAKLYTDLGLLSCRDDLGADLTDLFNYLTGFSKQKSYRKLLVAPVSLRDRMTALIRREIAHCQNGNPGYIRAKMNSLVDQPMIKTLYEASQAGVKIDLIVRGICCLRPGIAGVSDTIRVSSIVGRFLEHSRIFQFHNNGQEELYIGSADWMTRNLDRRVEAVTPVEDSALVEELKTILDILSADNRHAWDLQSDGSYIQRSPAEEETEQDAQTLLMQRVHQLNHSRRIS